jgi:hypothetical protein
MDAERFDALTRTLGCTTRRSTLRLLAAGTLGGLATAVLAAGTRTTTGAAPVGTAANRGSCRASGDVCNGDADCCSRHCRGGRCQCNRRGGHCAVDRACCSGRCRKHKERCA